MAILLNLVKHGRKHRMAVNIDKTNVMAMCGTRKPQVETNGLTLELKFNEFVCLGITVAAETETSESEVKFG